MIRLKSWHCFCLLVFTVLAAYFPSLDAGYNSVDDQNMIRWVESLGPITLQQLFFPQSGLYYYRPLTILTFLVDRDLWGTIPSFMHLENMLFHLVNTLLIFLIAKHLARKKQTNGYEIPLFAALLFAVHPLATESVCWISGRTDLLAGLFVFLSVWLFMVGLDRCQRLHVIAGGLCLLLACFAKEVAVFALPGIIWLMLVYPGAEESIFGRIKPRWFSLCIPTASIALYFFIRYQATTWDSGLKSAVSGAVAGDFDLLNKIRIAFKVYGFYFKKLWVPWPLNFAIIDISGWYVLCGILLLGILVWFMVRADLTCAFGLLSFCLLSPAILVVYGKMAWTLLAERYLYMSLGFFSPLVAVLFYNYYRKLKITTRPYFRLGLSLVLLVFFMTTLHRAWVWQSNIRLYQDTTTKSPGYIPAKNELANALFMANRVDEAEKILVDLQSGNEYLQYVNDDLGLAQIRAMDGDLEAARAILINKIDKDHKNYYKVLQVMLRINDYRIGEEKDSVKIEAIRNESLAWMLEQMRIRPSAFILYRIAKMKFAMGHKSQALVFFNSALERAPEDAHYRDAAKQYIDLIEGASK